MSTPKPPRRRPELSICFALAAVVLSLTTMVTAYRALDRIAPNRASELPAIDRSVEALAHRLEEISRRQQLFDWMRVEIQRANPRLDEEKAYEYGRLLLRVTDKYASVDPAFLLAVGIIESRFDARASSGAHAKGLYQILPATGRWLAEELGWEFTDALLYEPAKNTELAALYLDKLFDRYGDPKLALAEYNGGPVNARRYRNGSDELASETRDYVVKVMDTFDELNGRLELSVSNPQPSREAVLVAGL